MSSYPRDMRPFGLDGATDAFIFYDSGSSNPAMSLIFMFSAVPLPIICIQLKSVPVALYEFHTSGHSLEYFQLLLLFELQMYTYIWMLPRGQNFCQITVCSVFVPSQDSSRDMTTDCLYGSASLSFITPRGLANNFLYIYKLQGKLMRLLRRVLRKHI